MSAAGSQPARQPGQDSLLGKRGPMAYLLHALNQPLTGLECSLELAVAAPRRPEQQLHTLHESLELTRRMRVLVEAIRELADLQEQNAKAGDNFLLDSLVRETADDLRPVAETEEVSLRVAAEVPLPVRSSRGHLAVVLFRLLESSLSLARPGSEFRISAERDRAQAVLGVSWSPAPPPEHSPFSRAELGLLVAEAGWKRMGGDWLHAPDGAIHTITIRLPLASPACGAADHDGRDE